MAKKQKTVQQNAEQQTPESNVDDNNIVNISETTLTVTETEEGTVSELREISASFSPDNVLKTRH